MNIGQPYFEGRLGIIQRTLPEYRAPFFDTLAQLCTGGLSLFAGQPLPIESIATATSLQHTALFQARNHHFLAPSSPFYFCWQGGIHTWIQTWQPDVLIIEANPRYLSSPAAVRWMHRHGRPVVGWGLGAPKLKGIFGVAQTWQRNAFLNKLDGIIAYSDRGAAEYSAAGFACERVFTAYNAAAARPTAPLKDRELPNPGKQAVVLFVGRLQQRKRVDLLLQACAELPEGIQPSLQIVGDGPAREELEIMAQKVFPTAVFLGGKFGEELKTIFEQADILVLPGTGGLAIQQAMAHGLPVIAAEADGTQADLIRPASGWQVPPGDLPALRSTMAAALSDLPHLRQMGREAYRIVSEEINLESMAAAFVRAATVVRKLGLRQL